MYFIFTVVITLALFVVFRRKSYLQKHLSSTAQVVPDSNNVHAPIYSIVIALGTLMVDIQTAHVTMSGAVVIHYTVQNCLHCRM